MLTFQMFLQTGFCAISHFFSSYDAWKDFIVPILIALSAGYMVYWAFVKETKRDKKKERKVEKQLQKDKLSYFSNLVKNIVSISEQQNDNVLAFVKAQREDTSEVKQLLLYSLNELRRVTTDLQLESYMLAYVNYYKADRQVAIKEFNNMIVRMDMLYGTFKVMEPHLQLLKEDERNAKKQFKSYFDRASRLVSFLALRLRSSAPQLEAEMNVIAGASLRSMSEKNNVEHCYNTFFVPFNTFSLKYAWAFVPEMSQIQELAVLTKEGRLVYEQLVEAHESLADQFQAEHDRLKPEIEKLKEYAKRLLEDFGS